MNLLNHKLTDLLAAIGQLFGKNRRVTLRYVPIEAEGLGFMQRTRVTTRPSQDGRIVEAGFRLRQPMWGRSFIVGDELHMTGEVDDDQLEVEFIGEAGESEHRRVALFRALKTPPVTMRFGLDGSYIGADCEMFSESMRQSMLAALEPELRPHMEQQFALFMSPEKVDDLFRSEWFHKVGFLLDCPVMEIDVVYECQLLGTCADGEPLPHDVLFGVRECAEPDQVELWMEERADLDALAYNAAIVTKMLAPEGVQLLVPEPQEHWHKRTLWLNPDTLEISKERREKFERHRVAGMGESTIHEVHEAE